MEAAPAPLAEPTPTAALQPRLFPLQNTTLRPEKGGGEGRGEREGKKNQQRKIIIIIK